VELCGEREMVSETEDICVQPVDETNREKWNASKKDLKVA
jgi:hypothetical protein